MTSNIPKSIGYFHSAPISFAKIILKIKTQNYHQSPQAHRLDNCKIRLSYISKKAKIPYACDKQGTQDLKLYLQTVEVNFDRLLYYSKKSLSLN